MADVAPLDPTYGALYIGVLFATFFQGILTIQAYVYYEHFPEDSWKLKALVAAVWIVDLVHLIFVAEAGYHYLISSWGDRNSLDFSTWAFDAHLIPLGLATILCQGFFLWRIFVFSNRNVILVLALGSMCLACFGLDIFMAIENVKIRVVSEFQILVPEVTALFTMGAVSDLFIALLLCFYLRRGGSGFEKTNSIISRLVRYTVTTGLATSLLAIACLIAYFVRPNTFIFIGMHFSLGRMYTNALLATLNSRRSFRVTRDHTSIHRPTVNGKPLTTSYQTNGQGGHKSGGMPLPIEEYERNVRNSIVYKSSQDDRSSEDIELQAVKDGFKIGFGHDSLPV